MPIKTRIASLELNAEQLAELRAIHRRTPDKRAAYRLKALILLGEGWSAPQVAEALLIDPDTLRRWVGRYRAGGVEALTRLEKVCEKRGLSRW